MFLRLVFSGYIVKAISNGNLAEVQQFKSILYCMKRNKYFDSSNSKVAVRDKHFQVNGKEKCLNAIRVEEIKRSEGKLPLADDSDTFGTLSKESVLRERLEDLTEEEDDNAEEFLEGLDGKTRLRTLEYAKFIKQFLTEKKLLEAIDVLEVRMKKEKAKSNVYLYRLLISGCAKAGYTKKAFQLYNQMKKRGLKTKSSIYTSLFDACANSPWPNDGITRAAGLWELMLEKGVELNQQIAHAAIKAFGRCGEIERAFGIVDEMSVRGISITSETMNFLLQACATKKDTGFRHALMVWRKMMERNLMPTTYTYNLLLRCTRDCSVGDINKFKADLDTLLSSLNLELNKLKAPADVEREVPKNLNIVKTKEGNKETTLVPVLASQPSFLIDLKKIVKPWHRLMFLGGREGFINMMLSTGSKPDIKTFTQLLYTIGPNIEEEKLLMAQMNQLGIKRDLDFCNMLIKKRNINSNFPGAKEVLNIIREEQLIPNIVTFGVLALGSTNLRDSIKLLKEIKASGFRINIQILGTLLLSACRSWDFKAINFLVRQLTKYEMKPNIKFIQNLENFNQEIQRHIKMKKSGKGYSNKLDSPNFEKDLDDFKQLIQYVKSLEVEDQIFVHPWNQYRRREESGQQLVRSGKDF